MLIRFNISKSFSSPFISINAQQKNDDLLFIATVALTGWGHGATDEVVGYSMRGGVDENDKGTIFTINKWITTKSNSRDLIQAVLDDDVEIKKEKLYAAQYEQLKNIDENGEPIYQIMVLTNSHTYDGKPIVEMMPSWVDNENLALFIEE